MEDVAAPLIRDRFWSPFSICDLCTSNCVSECFWSLAKDREERFASERQAAREEGRPTQRTNRPIYRQSWQDGGRDYRAVVGDEPDADDVARRSGGVEKAQPVTDELSKIIADAVAEVEITLRLFHERTLALQKTSDELACVLKEQGEIDG